MCWCDLDQCIPVLEPAHMDVSNGEVISGTGGTPHWDSVPTQLGYNTVRGCERSIMS